MEIKTEERGHLAVIFLSGHFTIYDINDLEEIWTGLIKRNVMILALNCREILFIDSSAIGSLVKMVNLVTGRGAEVIFYDLGYAVEKVFTVTGLMRVLSVMSVDEFEKRFPPV